jgi:hypothetical protein
VGSTFLFAAMIALTYIVYWMVRNDHADQISDQTGLLRMRKVRSKAADDHEKAVILRKRTRRRSIQVKASQAQASQAVDTSSSEAAPAKDAPALVHPVYRHHARISRSWRRGQ